MSYNEKYEDVGVENLMRERMPTFKGVVRDEL